MIKREIEIKDRAKSVVREDACGNIIRLCLSIS